MQVQETLTNAIADLIGNRAAVCVAIVAVAILATGVEPILQLLDVRLPVRQLLVGRSMHALTLSGQVLVEMLRSYIGTAFRNNY